MQPTIFGYEYPTDNKGAFMLSAAAGLLLGFVSKPFGTPFSFDGRLVGPIGVPIGITLYFMHKKIGTYAINIGVYQVCFAVGHTIYGGLELLVEKYS